MCQVVVAHASNPSIQANNSLGTCPHTHHPCHNHYHHHPTLLPHPQAPVKLTAPPLSASSQKHQSPLARPQFSFPKGHHQASTIPPSLHSSSLLVFCHCYKPLSWYPSLNLCFTNVKISVLLDQWFLEICMYCQDVCHFSFGRILPSAEAILWKLLGIQQSYFFPQRELIIGKDWKRHFPRWSSSLLLLRGPFYFNLPIKSGLGNLRLSLSH